MLDQVDTIIMSYNELKEQMMLEENYMDVQKMAQLNRDLSVLEDTYHIASALQQAYSERNEAQNILNNESDADVIDLAQEQLDNAVSQIEHLEEALKLALLPKDPNDERNIYLEIRPAAGGDEAGLFAAELLKSYMLYAQQQGWQTELMDEQLTDIGGVKNVTLRMAGKRVYSKMKRESGVHRVQRVPATESQGRVHTSTVTVAVVPEVDDVAIDIDPNDVEMDTFAASSKGGQNANKNQTGVRLRHIPSGLIVTIGDSKSQIHNKEKAWAVLKSRLYQIELDKQQAQQTSERLDQIGSGDRSEKIRTYNFPQDRVTDHRIHQSWSNLPNIMQGNIDDLIFAVNTANQAALLVASVG